MARPHPAHIITDDSAIGGKIIEKSVRLNKADNAYFNRTSTVAGDRRTFTLSGWFKFYKPDDDQVDFIWMCGDSPSNQLQVSREGVTQINFEPKTGGSTDARFYTKSHFRGSSWYHLVLKIDTTQSTASDRMAFYINGVQDNEDTDLVATTYPSQNLELKWGENSISYVIGRRTHSGYEGNANMQVADLHYVSGYGYDATAFGYFDDQTGIWKPKKYTGSYGSAGWHLDFSDKTSTTTLGYDKSGNGNHFTANGLSVSSGIGNDSLLDTPTNCFPTWSRLSKNNSHTYSEGNQKVTTAANNQSGCVSTFGAPSRGKWYCEYHVQDSFLFAGVTADTYLGTGNVISATTTGGSTVAYYNDGQKYVGGSPSSYGASIGNGDVVGIALDMDGKKVTYYKNNSSQGAINLVDTTNGHLICTAVGTGQALSSYINFGQQEFTYTPPTGYKKISSANIVPEDPIIIRPKRHFDTVLYTGNGSTQSITGLEFKPDFVWIKQRSIQRDNQLYDVVRGATKRVRSNTTDAEDTKSAGLTSFNYGGFSLGDHQGVNVNSGTYVAWCWKAGGAAVTNNDGSITTQVSANQEAGFSIVTYTGNGTNGATIGHGLGKAPAMRFGRATSDIGTVGSAGAHWTINHQNLNAGMNGGSSAGTVFMNLTQAEENNNHGAIGAVSSTTATLSDGSNGSAPRPHVNESGETYVQYFFAEIPGYSRIGKYVGNNTTDGGYVHLGFKPAWIMIHKIAGEDTIIYDIKRATKNPVGRINGRLYASLNNGESGSTEDLDILATGFKLKKATGIIQDGSNPYIYMAFADQPGLTPFDTFPNTR